MSQGWSRREVLAGATGVALGGVAQGALSGREPKSFEFLFFSDTHVAFERNIEECRKMMLEMKWRTRPAFAINGGDVTDYGWAREYANWEALKEEFGVHTVETPGNHDVRWSPQGTKIFRERLGEPYRSFEHEGVKFFVLDSTVPLSHWGNYSRPQLDWLMRELRAWGRTKPVVLASHHWTGRDQVMIDNEDELRQILRPYNVKLMLTGHGHNDLLWDWDETVCTMNRGLYQGSWQKVVVDREANEIRLERWTHERRVLEELVKVSLDVPSGSREKRHLVLSGEGWSWAGSGVGYRAGQGAWSGDVPTRGDLVGGWSVVQTNRSGLWETEVREEWPEDGPVEKVWDVRLPGGVMSHLRAEGDALYATSLDGSVVCVGKEDGAIRWTGRTEGYCHSTPLVTGDLVVHGSADARLYAWDKATGRRQWTFKTDGPVYGGVTRVGDVLVFGSGDGRFYGVEAATGRMRWSTPMPESNTAYTQSVPTTDGVRAFLTGWDSHLYAVDGATGEIVWRRACQPRTFAFSPAIGSPCYAEGKVYCVANGNGLFRFDAVSGEQEYEVEAPGDKFGHSSAVYQDGRIYAGGLGDTGSVWCVAADTGVVIHEWRTGKVIYDSSPSLGDGFLAIGSVASQLNLCFLEGDWTVLKVGMPWGHFLATPLAEGRDVYAASFGERLVKLRVR